MTKAILFYRNSLLTKLFMLVILLVGGGNSVWAETIILNETSTNVNRGVPFNAGILTTSGTYGEFLVLPSQITSLTEKIITGLTFYTNKEANWGTASFTVTLKEVDNTCYTSSTGPLGDNGTTCVYSGPLSSSSDKEVSIIFDTPFNYNGNKSLLVRINCTNTTGTNVEVNFTGTNGADWSDANYLSYGTTASLTRQRFQPKVKITYETPSVSTLSVSPNENVTFGTVWANATKNDYYTITNNSASMVNVVAVIGGTHASSFSVSPSTPQNIAAGETQTYSISYTYESSLIGEKNATITFTPDADDTNAITKNISATAISNFTISSTDGVFGNVTADANKVYTIINNTGSAVTISPNIIGSDMFSISPSAETAIANGDSQEFTVAFDWQADVTKLNVEKSAKISLTPDNGMSAFEINASATAITDVILNEEEATTWASGAGKSVLVKYQPSAGWNTLCVPISTSNNMTNIFGSKAEYGTKYYTLTGYSNGVLTITNKGTGYVGANTPCIVYVETAKDNSLGVLLTEEYVYQASNGSPGKVDLTVNDVSTTILQGTYTGISMHEKYGLTPSGKIMKGGSNSTLKGFHAYFTNVAPSLGEARISFVIEDDDETTDLRFVKLFDEKVSDTYNLQGQKVQKGRKGIYIVNGRKVVVK